MKKCRLLMVVVIALQLVGCASGPSLEEVDTVVNPPTQPATSVSPSLEPAEPVAPETQAPTNIPEIPTSTPEITPTSAPVPAGYCDYEAAMRVVSKLDELTKTSEEKNTNSDQTLTEAERLIIIALFSEKILELDLMNVPGCLEKSVELLRTSYVGFKELFSVSEDTTGEEAFGILVSISQTQKEFNEEYARVKACIPTGCR